MGKGKEIMENNKMSGIYIKDISMPNGGTLKIEIGYDADGYPMAICDNKNVYDVIPVPPHGDLIDKKTVSENLASVLNKKNPPFSYPNWNDAICAMLTAPAIIPTDKEH